MPVIDKSTYQSSLLFKLRHISTVYPTLFRKVRGVNYKRTRITTPDKDFLDLDFSEINGKRIVLIVHGLEGNSTRQYVLGMVKAFNSAGYDTVSMNLRGCSGEPNKALRFYHSGATDDLDTVIRHIISLKKYQSIHLTGFSLGGNMVLKYAGERGDTLHKSIKSVVAISVPCDLAESSHELDKMHNIIYMKRFLRELGQKFKIKNRIYPGMLDLDGMEKIKNFSEFDNRFTAPLHGFKNAADYWKRSSSKQFLSKIKIPALLINALDDPFLGKECFPYNIAKKSRYFHLETPKHGGHVGFAQFSSGTYWSEKRAVEFTEKYL